MNTLIDSYGKHFVSGLTQNIHKCTSREELRNFMKKNLYQEILMGDEIVHLLGEQDPIKKKYTFTLSLKHMSVAKVQTGPPEVKY